MIEASVARRGRLMLLSAITDCLEDALALCAQAQALEQLDSISDLCRDVSRLTDAATIMQRRAAPRPK